MIYTILIDEIECRKSDYCYAFYINEFIHRYNYNNKTNYCSFEDYLTTDNYKRSKHLAELWFETEEEDKYLENGDNNYLADLWVIYSWLDYSRELNNEF